MATYVFRKESPRFDGNNYTIWKDQMEVHLKCLGEEYWKLTKNTHNVPLNGPVTTVEIKDVEHNIRAKEALISALTNSKMTNVMGLQTAHEI